MLPAKMRFIDLNYEVLQKVVGVYDQVIGGNVGKRLLNLGHLEEALKQLPERHPVEWRFGSTKLWVEHVPFSDSNGNDLLIQFRFDGDYVLGSSRAKALEYEFDQSIERLLLHERLIVSRISG